MTHADARQSEARHEKGAQGPSCFVAHGGVVLVSRTGELWRVTCDESELPEMYKLLAQQAERPDTSIDWFEASLVADRLTELHHETLP